MVKQSNRITVTDDGFLTYDAFRFPCAIGKAGMVSEEHKREGDLKTPIGNYLLRKVLYRADKVDEPVTALPTQVINQSDGWCDDPKADAYNQQVTLPFHASHEKLWREDDLYDIVVVLSHNEEQVPGKGSAIFMHVAKPAFQPTEGCIGLEKTDLQLLLRAIPAQTIISMEEVSLPEGEFLIG